MFAADSPLNRKVSRLLVSNACHRTSSFTVSLCYVTCRPEQALLAENGKRTRVDPSGGPGYSPPVDSVPSLHTALASKPSLNGHAPSSTSVPVPDSEGVTLRPTSDHQEGHRRSQKPSDQPSSTRADLRAGAADSHQQPDPTERPRQSSRHHDSHRAHRSDSMHDRHDRDSRHRSTSQRPTQSSRRAENHRASARSESRRDSRMHDRGGDRQVNHHSQPGGRPDARPDHRGSNTDRHRFDSRDASRGRRDYDKDRIRDAWGQDRSRQSYSRGAGWQDRHRESDSHRDKRKREEKEDKVPVSSPSCTAGCPQS